MAAPDVTLSIKGVDSEPLVTSIHLDEGQARSPAADTAAKAAKADAAEPAVAAAVAAAAPAAGVASAPEAKTGRCSPVQADALDTTCPACGCAQHADAGKRDIICRSCAKPFCIVHGAAHAGETCATYELRAARTQRAALHAHEDVPRQPVAEKAHPCCPSCGYAEKRPRSAAVHCTSLHCFTHYCAHCGETLQHGMFKYPLIYPSHFFSGNLLSPCAGKQYSGLDASRHGPQGQGCSDPWLAVRRAVGILNLAVFAVPALVVVLAWYVVCPCFAVRNARGSGDAPPRTCGRVLWDQLIAIVNALASTLYCLVIGLPLALVASLFYGVRALVRCCCGGGGGGGGPTQEVEQSAAVQQSCGLPAQVMDALYFLGVIIASVVVVGVGIVLAPCVAVGHYMCHTQRDPPRARRQPAEAVGASVARAG